MLAVDNHAVEAGAARPHLLKVSAAEAGVRSRLRPVQRLAVPPCPRVQHHGLRHPFPVIPMHRSLAILVFALAVTVVDDVHAQGISPARMPVGQEPPSITLPPSLDRVLREYEAAWRKGDAAGLAALFAEDGFVLQSGRAPARGYAYDPQRGDPREGFAAGTPWASIPADWTCPDCGVRDKADFVPGASLVSSSPYDSRREDVI